MKTRSLRVRLLLAATLAIFVALAVTWATLTYLFERHVERRVESDLRREGLQLAASVATTPDGRLSLEREPGDVRFNEPASGLYWQASSVGDMLRSRSLWDETLPRSQLARSSQWTVRFIAGPFDQQLLLVERIVRPERGGTDVLLQVAQENRAVLAARTEFSRELALYLGVLWLILSAATWAQVTLGLRPLVRIRDEVEALKRNPRERMHAADAVEIEPLTRAINELADAREKDLLRARRRAADLAHGLKTPLAALSAQSRRAREAGATDTADALDRAIGAASTAIEGELARSRAATVVSSAGQRAPVLPLVESIIGVLERTDAGGRIVFDVDVAESLELPIASDDLLEAMGALIENASRYARRRVQISGASGGSLRLSVDDDGPGIATEQLADAVLRGARLDETGSGHGMGLAIAHDLVEASGGRLTLERSALGGLRASVEWSKAPST